MPSLQDTLKLGSLSVPSRIFMVAPASDSCEFFNTVTFNLAWSFDAVAFGTKFLANPDLPARIAAGAELNAPKADLFYTGKVGDLKYTGPEGYTDYPPLTPN